MTEGADQLGRYQILKQLASGGVADVLLARAVGIEGFARHVVIKRIREDLAKEGKFVNAFLDEARIAASLHHQNIVQVHDIGEEHGAFYFAMEYVHGEDARKLLLRVREQGADVPIDHVVAIANATAAGLHHAHEQLGPTGEPLGLVHRDVSPANILIGYDGSVKLVDFGLAKAALRSAKTASNMVKGKASYMSPEQCRGLRVDRRTDIFALGIVLYELATARRLFKGATEFLTMAAVVEGQISPPSAHRPDIPRELDAIVMRALARDPAARYQTAEELRLDLETFALEHGLRTSPKALADYLATVFGERAEPWHGDSVTVMGPAVDFDPGAGIVRPPENDAALLERLAPGEASPLAIAQGLASVSWHDGDDQAPTDARTPPIRLPDDDEEYDATVVGAPQIGPDDTTAIDEALAEPTATRVARARSDIVYVGPPAPKRFGRWAAIAAGGLGGIVLVAVLARSCGGGGDQASAPDAVQDDAPGSAAPPPVPDGGGSGSAVPIRKPIHKRPIHRKGSGSAR